MPPHYRQVAIFVLFDDPFAVGIGGMQMDRPRQRLGLLVATWRRVLEELVDRIGSHIGLYIDVLPSSHLGVPSVDRCLLHLVPGDKGNVLLMGPGPNRSGLVCRGEDVGHRDDPGPVVGKQLVIVGGAGDLRNLVGVIN